MNHAVPESFHRPAWILPVIVMTQFACTSLWFAGNAVIGALQVSWHLPDSAQGLTLASVQLGFVAGTLVFAVLAIADRFRATSVFFCCALLGAASNLALVFVPGDVWTLVASRAATGFFLAGIYPVGMKIAASWCDQGLGRALGYLVGALVVGSALPHLLTGLGTTLPWQAVIGMCSAATVAGGLAVFVWVPMGPHLPQRSPFNIHAIPEIFSFPKLRAAAFGYFGHMWELYAVWAFFPLLVHGYAVRHGLDHVNASLWAFALIAAGAVGCAGGGELVRRFGSARVALIQLATSGCACVLVVLAFAAPAWLFFTFLLVWGIAVAGDSPQFSTLVGMNVPSQYVGTAFTIVNGIGFAISAVSIQLLAVLSATIPVEYLFLLLIPGPALGLYAARRLLRDGRFSYRATA
ncbi:MAG: MFS transporter [Nevskiaceae bacterium]|nr:MAG: MFS transporter [Nevskiaceae bacterium]TBR74574.1 MAG: MFS transporter [Nevskiaceae bacterium]